MPYRFILCSLLTLGALSASALKVEVKSCNIRTGRCKLDYKLEILQRLERIEQRLDTIDRQRQADLNAVETNDACMSECMKIPFKDVKGAPFDETPRYKCFNACPKRPALYSGGC